MADVQLNIHAFFKFSFQGACVTYIGPLESWQRSSVHIMIDPSLKQPDILDR